MVSWDHKSEVLPWLVAISRLLSHCTLFCFLWYVEDGLFTVHNVCKFCHVSLHTLLNKNILIVRTCLFWNLFIEHFYINIPSYELFMNYLFWFCFEVLCLCSTIAVYCSGIIIAYSSVHCRLNKISFKPYGELWTMYTAIARLYFSDKWNKRTYLDILNNGKGSQQCQIEIIVFIQMNAYKHSFLSIYSCWIVLIDIL